MRRLAGWVAALLLLPACGGGGSGPDQPGIALSASALSFLAAEGGADPADQTVTISNGGAIGTVLNWTATSDQPWLTVTPSSGVTSSPQSIVLTLHVDAAYQTEAWEAPTATLNAPSPRWLHSMVATGSEVIVWGGSTAVVATDVQTGARFNPSTNEWIGATSLASVPSPRRYTTAVWTGSNAIFWGGVGSSGFDSGHLYAPNAWGGTIAAGPAARAEHTAVWTGAEMIVFGGWDGSLLSTGHRYNALTNTWSATNTGGAAARQEHAAVWTGSQMIVWGGRVGPDASWSVAAGQRYNPGTDTWSDTVTTLGQPTARTWPSAVWTGREMIVWGGHDGATWLNNGARYNPAIDTWVATLPMTGVPAARYRHGAVWTGSRMVVWGGQTSSGMTATGAVYRPPIPAIGPHVATIAITAPGAATRTVIVDLDVTP